MLDATKVGSVTFLNPVYPHSFPDPFVFKHGGAYYAYATGFAQDGTVFPVLHSDDLVNWNDVGGAMPPIASGPPLYWAPEVTYDNGKFYLYYSAGNETFMELRVAVSDRPDRGFTDAGIRLTKEDFAIDAHVFVDDDGSKHLFYATDFLTHSHIGTGTVVDRMIDCFTLEGNPRPVTRAKYDWQVYDPNRKEKGGVRWHTVEGPAVLKRKDKYFEMFSGGNWQNTTYGVSFAMSDDLDGDDEWLQFSDGVNTLPILRTIPDIVVGPGHNCVVRGPNNRELYCVYHRWTESGRVMAIDRMDFAGERIIVVGATHTPQPLPYQPKIKERFREQLLQEFRQTGKWTVTESGTVSDPTRLCAISPQVPRSFLLEITGSFAESSVASGTFGVEFKTDDDTTALILEPSIGARITSRSGDASTVALPPEFDWTASHLVRIDADYRRLSIYLDSIALSHKHLDSPINQLKVFSKDQAVLLSTFDLTEGFEELFIDDLPLQDNGWTVDGTDNYRIEQSELCFNSTDQFMLRKGPTYESLELAANIRVLDENEPQGEFGLVLFNQNDEVFRLSVDAERSVILANGEIHNLPQEIHLAQHHQLRIVRMHDGLLCYFDDVLVAEVADQLPETSAGVFAKGVRVAIDMIRLTSI